MVVTTTLLCSKFSPKSVEVVDTLKKNNLNTEQYIKIIWIDHPNVRQAVMNSNQIKSVPAIIVHDEERDISVVYEKEKFSEYMNTFIQSNQSRSMAFHQSHNQMLVQQQAMNNQFQAAKQELNHHLAHNLHPTAIQEKTEQAKQAISRQMFGPDGFKPISATQFNNHIQEQANSMRNSYYTAIDQQKQMHQNDVRTRMEASKATMQEEEKASRQLRMQMSRESDMQLARMKQEEHERKKMNILNSLRENPLNKGLSEQQLSYLAESETLDEELRLATSQLEQTKQMKAIRQNAIHTSTSMSDKSSHQALLHETNNELTRLDTEHQDIMNKKQIIQPMMAGIRKHQEDQHLRIQQSQAAIGNQLQNQLSTAQREFSELNKLKNSTVPLTREEIAQVDTQLSIQSNMMQQLQRELSDLQNLKMSPNKLSKEDSAQIDTKAKELSGRLQSIQSEFVNLQNLKSNGRNLSNEENAKLDAQIKEKLYTVQQLQSKVGGHTMDSYSLISGLSSNATRLNSYHDNTFKTPQLSQPSKEMYQEEHREEGTTSISSLIGGDSFYPSMSDAGRLQQEKMENRVELHKAQERYNRHEGTTSLDSIIDGGSSLYDIQQQMNQQGPRRPSGTDFHQSEQQFENSIKNSKRNVNNNKIREIYNREPVTVPRSMMGSGHESMQNSSLSRVPIPEQGEEMTPISSFIDQDMIDSAPSSTTQSMGSNSMGAYSNAVHIKNDQIDGFEDERSPPPTSIKKSKVTDIVKEMEKERMTMMERQNM